jgi:hypothetical protein
MEHGSSLRPQIAMEVITRNDSLLDALRTFRMACFVLQRFERTRRISKARQQALRKYVDKFVFVYMNDIL